MDRGHKALHPVRLEPAILAAGRDHAKEKLDQKLMERQARDSGICPVREKLYSQCFDEIIRQVTIKCPEHELLLMRVRDEIKMTIADINLVRQLSHHWDAQTAADGRGED